MEEKTTSTLPKKVKSASTWAFVLGSLKLIIGFASIFFLDSMVGEITNLNTITIIFTIIVGGLMIFWGLRIRNGHPDTTKYVNYLIVLISISLILGVVAVQAPKIVINAWALYVFIQARNHLKN